MPLDRRADGVFEGWLPDVFAGARYRYRLGGPPLSPLTPLLHHDAVDRAASTDPFAFRLLGFGIACVIASARYFLT